MTIIKEAHIYVPIALIDNDFGVGEGEPSS